MECGLRVELPLLVDSDAEAAAWTQLVAADVSRDALCQLAECARVLCEPGSTGSAPLAALRDRHAALCPLLMHLLAIAVISMPYDASPLHVAAVEYSLATLERIYASVVAAQLLVWPDDTTALALARYCRSKALPVHLVDVRARQSAAALPVRAVQRGAALHTYHTDGRCECTAKYPPLAVAFSAPPDARPSVEQLLSALCALHPRLENQRIKCTLAAAGAGRWLCAVWTLMPTAESAAAEWGAALRDTLMVQPEPLAAEHAALIAELGPGGAREAAGVVDTVAHFVANPLARMVPVDSACAMVVPAAGTLGTLWTDGGDVQWRVLAPLELPAWLGAQARRTVEAARATVVAEHKGKPARFFEALQLTDALELAAPLIAMLRTNMVQRATLADSKVRAVHRAPASVLWQQPEYLEVERAVAANAELAYRFFVDLVAGDKVTPSGHGWFQANSHLSFCCASDDGRNTLRWNERGTRHMSAADDNRGRGLGTLVMHRSTSRDPGEAYAYVMEWWHRRDAAPPEPPCAAVQSAMRRTQESDRQRIAKLLASSTAVTQGTVAHRYLCEHRGLPAALVEGCAALRAVSELFWRESDDQRWQRLAGMLALSEDGERLQRTYLYPDTAAKCNDIIKGGRKQLGGMEAAAGGAPGVCVQRGYVQAHPPVGETCANAATHTALIFVAEGVETALSVAAAYPECAVYATLGTSNLERFVVRDPAAAVVVCRENDAADVAANTERDMRLKYLPALRRRAAAVHCVWPPRDPGVKDFNDVHQRLPGEAGSAAIRQCIDAQLAAATSGGVKRTIDLTSSVDGDAKRRCLCAAVSADGFDINVVDVERKA